MPKNKNAFIRYRIIDSAIRNKHKKFPSKLDLIEACSGLGQVSARTIDGDIYDMKFDEELGYAAPIEYNRKQKGYYYSDPNYSINNLPLKQEDLYALEFACSLLKQFDGVEPIKQFMQSVEKIEDYVNLRTTYGNDDFLQIVETEKSLTQLGNEHLSTILQSIKEQQTMLLHYQGYGHTSVKVYQLHAYVLKEYRNRWYVVGQDANSNQIKTFALERIKQIIPTNASFTRDPDFNPANYFKYSFGISVNDLHAQEIHLQFNPKEAPFIKSQPLHQTQKILVDNDKKLVIAITVIPSYELKSHILSYGSQVKIIKPKALATEIKNTLSQAAAQY